MSKILDLTGQILGPWKVLHRLENNAHQEVCFAVRCLECGHTDRKRSISLRRRHYGKCKRCKVLKNARS